MWSLPFPLLPQATLKVPAIILGVTVASIQHLHRGWRGEAQICGGGGGGGGVVVSVPRPFARIVDNDKPTTDGVIYLQNMDQETITTLKAKKIYIKIKSL